MFLLTKSGVVCFARNDVASNGRNDVMFAHYAEGTTSLPKATSLGEADITCMEWQTSLAYLLYCRSPFGVNTAKLFVLKQGRDAIFFSAFSACQKK